MSQPRTQARRTRRLIVRTSDEEHTLIGRRAAEAGLTRSEYARRMLIDGRVEVNRELGYARSLVHQLRRIGVNINQLMAIAHIDGVLPPDLIRLSAKLEVLLDRMLGRLDIADDKQGGDARS